MAVALRHPVHSEPVGGGRCRLLRGRESRAAASPGPARESSARGRCAFTACRSALACGLAALAAPRSPRVAARGGVRVGHASSVQSRGQTRPGGQPQRSHSTRTSDVALAAGHCAHALSRPGTSEMSGFLRWCYSKTYASRPSDRRGASLGRSSGTTWARPRCDRGHPRPSHVAVAVPRRAGSRGSTWKRATTAAQSSPANLMVQHEPRET